MKASSIDPNSLGAALATQGRLGEAIAAFERAVALSPDDPASHRNLAKAMKLAGRIEEAALVCRGFVGRHADDGRTWGLLGELLLERGRLSEAEPALRRAAELEPAEAAWHTSLGVARRRAGDVNGAVESFGRVRAPQLGVASFPVYHCDLED